MALVKEENPEDRAQGIFQGLRLLFIVYPSSRHNTDTVLLFLLVIVFLLIVIFISLTIVKLQFVGALHYSTVLAYRVRLHNCIQNYCFEVLESTPVILLPPKVFYRCLLQIVCSDILTDYINVDKFLADFISFAFPTTVPKNRQKTA